MSSIGSIGSFQPLRETSKLSESHGTVGMGVAGPGASEQTTGIPQKKHEWRMDMQAWILPQNTMGKNDMDDMDDMGYLWICKTNLNGQDMQNKWTDEDGMMCFKQTVSHFKFSNHLTSL